MANKIYSAKLSILSRTISNRFSRTACQLWAPKVAWLVLSNPKNSRDLPVFIHLWDRRHHFQGANVVIRNSHGRLENGLTWRATATRRWGCGNKPSCNEVILGFSESKLHDPKRPLCTLWSPLESPPLEIITRWARSSPSLFQPQSLWTRTFFRSQSGAFKPLFKHAYHLDSVSKSQGLKRKRLVLL